MRLYAKRHDSAYADTGLPDVRLRRDHWTRRDQPKAASVRQAQVSETATTQSRASRARRHVLMFLRSTPNPSRSISPTASLGRKSIVVRAAGFTADAR